MPLLMISHYAIIISTLIRHYDIDCHWYCHYLIITLRHWHYLADYAITLLLRHYAIIDIIDYYYWHYYID
jgi:hypothetical protein